MKDDFDLFALSIIFGVLFLLAALFENVFTLIWGK